MKQKIIEIKGEIENTHLHLEILTLLSQKFIE